LLGNLDYKKQHHLWRNTAYFTWLSPHLQEGARAAFALSITKA
jgi:hypothetical protein